MKYYKEVLRKYTVFKGRASRSEFWYFVLFSTLIIIGLSMIKEAFGDGFGIFGSLYSLAVLIPTIAVAVRRLHDTNRSGWWLFISLIPLIGIIVLLIFNAQPSDSGSNKYGSKPVALK